MFYISVCHCTLEKKSLIYIQWISREITTIYLFVKGPAYRGKQFSRPSLPSGIWLYKLDNTAGLDTTCIRWCAVPSSVVYLCYFCFSGLTQQIPWLTEKWPYQWQRGQPKCRRSKCCQYMAKILMHTALRWLRFVYALWVNG